MDDSTRRALMANADERARSLLLALEELRSHCLEAESEFSGPLAEVLPLHRVGALNLAHYVALRRHDLRDIQEELAHLGLSSLGRSEAHVLASLETVIGVLQQLTDVDHSARRLSSVEVETPSLDRNADRLLGPLPADRATRIMVTLPAEAAEHLEVVAAEFVRAGMDVARINCAHDTPEDWHAMAGHVRQAAAAEGRPCLIAMDLAGPKLRTGPLPLGPPVVKIKPERDMSGIVLAPARLVLRDGPAIPSPSSTATDIPVLPAGVLSPCRVGDVIRLRDARSAKRSLVVVEVLPYGVLVESHKTVYLETGLPLKVSKETSVTATIGPLPRRESALTLHIGDELTLIRETDQSDTAASGELRVSCTLPEVFVYARVGHRVWFDDGKFGGVVSDCSTDELTVRIVEAPPGGARLRGGKGINLPDTELPIPGLSTQDEADLVTAVELADVINVSFVRNSADVELVQAHLAALGASNLGIVLKIETVAGFERLPEILLAAMRSERIGVMIARGDLAIEAGYERMAEVQEEILWLCEAAHVPVIWATQVLDQLARTGRPSRAEVTDAALAARAECIMLNKGPHILLAMATLLDINRRMDDHQRKKRSLLRRLRAWDRAGRSGDASDADPP